MSCSADASSRRRGRPTSSTTSAPPRAVRPIEYCADLRRIYVDPDMGDAGIEQNGGETPRMRMVRGSSEAERFSPSSADAGGVICLGWR